MKNKHNIIQNIGGDQKTPNPPPSAPDSLHFGLPEHALSRHLGPLGQPAQDAKASGQLGNFSSALDFVWEYVSSPPLNLHPITLRSASQHGPRGRGAEGPRGRAFAVFGCFWLFLGVFGCFWLFLVVFMCFWTWWGEDFQNDLRLVF